MRDAFIAGTHAVTPLLESPALAERWEQPSVLTEFTVRGLAGHLLRAVTATRRFLENPEPSPPAVDAAAWFATATAGWPSQAEAIRQRGETEAEAGQAAMVAEYTAGIADLERILLAPGAATRLVERDGFAFTMDDLLAIRAVELIVHADDLAVSIDVDTPTFEPTLVDAVVGLLVGAARARHGDLAVIRAMTRRERDTDGALRVI